MVSLDTLKRSQIARPRHAIVVLGIISMILLLPLTLLYIWLLVPGSSLLAELATKTSWVKTMHLGSFMAYLGFPILIVALGFFPFCTLNFMAKCRHPYYWLSTPTWTLFSVTVLGGVGLYSILFIPGLYNFLAQRLNIAEFLNVFQVVFLYVAVGYGAFLCLAAFFAIIYNVNYPAKYEEIYTRRAARIRAYPSYYDQKAYRIRFYENYRDGNWYQMMLDLYFKELSDPRASLDDACVEFMCEYAGYNNGQVRSTALREYHRRGDDKKLRELFFNYLAMRQSLENGAKLVLPGDVTLPGGKKTPVRSYPAPYVPPLAPQDQARPRDPNATNWSPDDIY